MRTLAKALASAVLVAFVPAMAQATALTGSGPGTISTTQLSNGSAQFTYSDNNTQTIYYGGDTWTLSGISDVTGAVTLNWSSTLNYEQYAAAATASAFSGSTSTLLYSTSPDYTATYSGSVTLNLVAGQAYGYTIHGSNYDYLTTLSGTFTSTQAPSAVPEPAAWTLMLIGFGAIGAALRRRKPAVVRFG